jgi:hypothetical protein
MRRRGLLAAAAIVLLANAIALLGVSRNRASTLQTIDLTERELTLGYQGEENSGIDLHLAASYEPTLNWFDAAKLQELGFPAAISSTDDHRVWPARPAYVAFEYDGPAWQAVFEQQRKTPLFVAANFGNQSRLVPIDASRDPVALNTHKRLIVRATVQPGVVVQDGKAVVRGRIANILDSQIHVPLPDALALEKLPPRPGNSDPPRYTVRLAYGARFEPWVISVTAIPK